jgi:3-dehydro-L-gulonate 2-dehydrogenase
MKVFISYQDMKSEFMRILINNGFTDVKAKRCAEIFSTNSLEGVYSHGVNRFPRFVDNVKKGYIIPSAEPSIVNSNGSLEQWDGNLGPGPTNALFATDRAIHLAVKNGIGLVAVGNTNHWMRGGTYGWHAARLGFLFIGWTNTEANMPAWGACDARLGNNPLVFAIPYKNEAIVLDFAMSQYSYGKLEIYQLENKDLPFPGGFNERGDLTVNPGDILASRRVLPVGYWKGSGLSLLLDLFAAILSGGLTTSKISEKEAEYALSQIFIAINVEKLSNHAHIHNIIDSVICDLKKSSPEKPGMNIRYPGENIVKVRKENMNRGIPVNDEIWKLILSL